MEKTKNNNHVDRGFRSLRAKLLQKRIKMKMLTWRMMFFAIIALVLVFGGGLVWSYTAATEQEVEHTTYYCLQEASFNYRVYLMPNELFTEKSLAPGRAYITTLTDYIALDFEYNYFGESEVDISGEYGITAELVAIASAGEEKHLVWEKRYDLLAVQEVDTVDSDFSITERVTVPVAEYLDFSEKVREETGYNPAELNLIIKGDVNMEAETAEGAFSEELNPTLIIPLRGNIFTVTGELIDEKEGGITTTQTVAATTVEDVRSTFPVLLTTTAIALFIFRIIFVPVEDEPRRKPQQVRSILKKHKERIVVTANGVTSVPQEAITVYSFDELIKLADEVGKPILYPQPKAANGSEHIFLIYTPEKIYAYGLSENADTLTQKE